MKTFLPAILAFALLTSLPARATEMPADLNPQARIQAAPAAAPSQSLDRVEMAELARSDANQKGGDAVVAIVVIAAIVALVYIFFEHMDRMDAKR